MSLWHLVLLALIQGITEFLPVSSSGHLILLPGLTGAEDQGLALDVAVHIGTLGAVILYFWFDVRVALGGTLRLAQGKIDTKGAFLALCLLIATIPVMAAGLALRLTGLDDALRSVAVIGWAMIVFGLVLYWADRTGAETRTAPEWTLKHAMIMGLWQVLALIPGTSRSGITITGEHDLIEAGEKILALGPDAVLLKGGHGQAEQVIDILLTRQGSRRFNHARLPGEFHGTGCVLSAAITAHLARDETLETAVELGLDYLQDRMSRAIPGDALSLLP